MSPLIELPDDILLEILSYFRYDYPALHALALSHRRLSPFANAPLYRKVSLDIHWPEECTFLSDSPGFSRILRTVNERPSLALLIRKLELCWVKNNFDSEPPSAFYSCINELLTKLPNVFSFKFESSGSINVISRIQLDRFDSVFMSRLRKLANTSDSSSISNIAKLIQLQNMESIWLWGSDEDIIIDASPATLQAKPNVSLRRIRFGPNIYVPAEVLRFMITLTPALRQLMCNFPGPNRYSVGPDVSTIASPGSLRLMLAPAQYSLTDLSILEGTKNEFSGHDGTRLDLSNFSALRCLTVKSKCFFKAKGPDGSRNRVFELLPRSLRVLAVSLFIVACIGRSNLGGF